MKVEPADPRKAHIEHQATVDVWRLELHQRGDRAKGSSLQPHGPEERRERLPQRPVVVDDQHEPATSVAFQTGRL